MDKQKNQLLRKIFYWIKVASLLFALIGVGHLIYQWWNRKQELAKLQAQLEQKKQEVQQQYQLQQEHLISLTELAKRPVIYSFFTDLLTTYTEKFARSKEMDISHLPLKFAGLYCDEKTGNGYREMGRCSLERIVYPIKQKVANISLNRLYLLNKLGNDKYFPTNPNQGDYSYLDISFDKMIDTCCHEIAHYIQLAKHGKSSCESDLVLNNGNYDGELAKEHEKFMEEIYQMVRNSGEYLEWEKKWKEI